MTDDKIVIADLANSLTGYEEVAITRSFGAPLDDLAGSMVMRALAFVVDKRTGLKDVDAYRAVMGRPVADIADRFHVPDDQGDEGDQGDQVGEVGPVGKADTTVSAPN